MAVCPSYISRATPNPTWNRSPWYTNIAPSYAGIFLWIVFYQALGEQTVRHAGLGVCLFALVVAGILCHVAYYYVPAMLGMNTGLPLYAIGSSTFGATGGYLMPGLLMGFLQVGWFAVGTTIATDFILKGLGFPTTPGSLAFVTVGVAWGYTTAFVGIKGIRYVGRVALLLNVIPLVMLIVVFFQTAAGISHYSPQESGTGGPGVFSATVALVLGFFATGGAAGADFGTSARNAADVRWGGIVGIVFAGIVAGGLALASVAGAHGLNPALSGYQYDDVVRSVGGPIATAMFLLFALASIPSACFCSFVIGNSFSTMVPQVSRAFSTMTGATVAIILAVTGAASDLIGFFSIVGASFSPICGAIAADYLGHGRQWAGPRRGINWAGYGAWAAGFCVGIIPTLPVSPELKSYSQPAPLYSCIVGFIVYLALARAGLEPPALQMATEPGPAGS